MYLVCFIQELLYSVCFLLGYTLPFLEFSPPSVFEMLRVICGLGRSVGLVSCEPGWIPRVMIN